MDRLLIHTCDVIQAGATTSYGQNRPDFATPAATTRGLACNWQPLDERARERNLASGAVLASHLLVLPYASAPGSLLAHAAEAWHRIANIRREGVLVDAGPYHIQTIDDAGGQGRLLELRLLRAG